MATSNKPTAPSRADIGRWFDVLPEGVENARTAEALCHRLGWIDEKSTPAQIENAKRRFRLMSEHAVFMGYVYCADDRGYFRPTSEQVKELDATLGRRESQALRTLAWIKQMRMNVSRSLTQGRLI